MTNKKTPDFGTEATDRRLFHLRNVCTGADFEGVSNGGISAAVSQAV